MGVVLGLVLASAAAILYITAVYLRINAEDPHQVVLAAVLSVTIIPFFLPMMHERYFYTAELLSIALLLVNWRYLVIPVLQQISTGNLYWMALRRKGYFFPQEVSAVINLALMVLLAWLFWRLTAGKAHSNPMQPEMNPDYGKTR